VVLVDRFTKMKLLLIIAALFFVLFVIDYAECQNPKIQTSRKKSTSTCPSKCTIAKKLESVTERLTEHFYRLEERYEQMAVGSQNLASSIEVETLRANVSTRIDSVVEDLFSYISNKEELQRIKESTKPCCAAEEIIRVNSELKDSKRKIEDLEAVQQNITLNMQELLNQNELLRSNAKALHSVAQAVRKQNDYFNEENIKLKAQALMVDQKLANMEDRIKIMEKTIAEDNCTCDYVQVGILSAAMEPPIILGSQSITKIELNQRESDQKLQRIEDWVKSAVKSGTWLPTLEPPINPMLQGNIDQAPRDCFDIFHMGFRESGPYKIQPESSPAPFEVFCEQRYNGGGWTVFQKRRDGSVNFDRSYEEYAQGFGDPVGEYWLGNDKIYHLTHQGPHVLHIALQDWNNVRRYAEYDSFLVDTARNSYQLTFGSYQGTAGDAFRGPGGKNILYAEFSAKEYDNDRCQPCWFGDDRTTLFDSCARVSGSGWWFHACADANLNGRFLTREEWMECKESEVMKPNCLGIKWNGGDDELDNISLRATVMMIRPTSGA